MDRIYIDATSTANTLHHTGIQRIVRSLVLYGAVRIEEWVPLVWDGHGYRAPTRFERRRLTDVFASGLHRKRALSRFLERFEKRWEVDFSQEGENALFLLPEIPSGSRLAFLDDLAATGARQMTMAAVCHDLFSWSHPEWTADSRREGFVEYLRFLALIERVICPSQSTASEWRRFQREEGVVGPDPEVLPWPVGGEVAEQTDDPGEMPMILCVGTLEARKNHGRLLQAAGEIWKKGLRFELVLAGRLRARGEREIPEKVAALAARGLPVRWEGEVDESRLEELYGRCWFTVFPSEGEGFGLPVAESLARGRPCICSGEGAMGEIADGGGCLTTDVSDPGAIARSLESLLTGHSRRKALALEAAGRVWPSWDDWMDKLAGTDPAVEDTESTPWI